jgi:hypothetical protein
MFKNIKLYYGLEKCLEIPNISLRCYHDICMYALWLYAAKEWASMDTHYHELDKWTKSSNDIIRDNLYKYGFINGQGSTNNDSEFWWKIYQLDPTLSPNIVSNVQKHHASAWERNNCLWLEIEYLIQHFKDKII